MRTKRTALTFCSVLLSCALLSGTLQAAAFSGRFNMSYLYFGSPSSYVHTVQQTKGSLQEIAPNYFNLTPEGNLDITGSGISSFVSSMHKQGIKVVPFLSNHWDRALGIRALNNRVSLAQQIADAIQTYNLDGINVDIENVTHEQRNAYSEFVELLRRKLPRDKVVAVAVAANPYGFTTGWHGSYDYARLVKSADYLMMMTYDEHYQGGEPGPVASYSFMEKSVQYALKYAPREKLVLGIPFFGRVWSNSGTLMKGNGVNETQIASLIKQYRGVVKHDPASGSAYATITVTAADPKPTIHGKTLTAGQYTIWYESEQSKKRQLSLVEKYDLLGSGSWSLGQEFDNTWDYYSLWLNGRPFSDTQGHWATQAVIETADRGWMTGQSSTAFGPNRSLTRAEAAAVLCRVRAFSAAPAHVPDFSDTKGHWAEDEIRTAYYHGLVEGIGAGQYAPDAPVSRQEMAVMLHRAFPQVGALPSRSPFPDVSRHQFPWSYEAILRLTQAGIFNGFGDGTFRPTAMITRAELASLLTRLAALLDL